MAGFRTALAAGLALAGATMAACDDPPAPAVPTTQVFSDELLGLSFELPADWTHERVGQRHIFSGPEQTKLFFTTITLQPLGAGEKLDVALARAYAPLLGYRGFAWERREPATIGGRAALRYGVTFELYEQQRRKSGVVLDAGDQLIDLSYAATDELFAVGLPAFAGVVDSLSFY